MLRVAGLPWSAVEPLACERTTAWAASVLEAERRLEESARGISDAIAPLVTDQEQQVRRALLGLRRDLFNVRVPRARNRTEQVLAALPGELAEAVSDWVVQRRALEERRAEGEHLLAEEIEGQRGHLRRLAHDPRLRNGLLLASPSLERHLPAYLEAPSGRLSKRARKIERSLVEYVFRTACKTSPFSSLTTVAAGTYTDDPVGPSAPTAPGNSGNPGDPAGSEGSGPSGDPADTSAATVTPATDTPGTTGVPAAKADPGAPTAPAPADAALTVDPSGTRARSHVRINVALLGRIADLVAEDWARLTDLPVVLSSGHSLDRERVRYVRRTKHGGEGEGAEGFESLREELFYLSNSDLLDEVLDILGTRPGLRLGELVERLGSAADDRDPAEVRAYVEALIRLSLVRLPSLDVDIHSGDPLRTFRDGMAALDRPWADPVVAELDHAADLVAAYAEAGTDGRRRLRDEVRETFDRAAALLSPDPAPMPQGVLYEDVSLPELDPRADKGTWQRGLMGDLHGLSAILPLFDMLLPHRLVLLGFFRARYGQEGVCEDVLGFVHEFHRDIYDQYLQSSARRKDFDGDGEYVPLDNWLRMPEMTALDTARRELVARMRLAYAALEDPDGELVLDDEFMAAVAGELPPAVHRIDSRSFFVQVAEGDGRPYGVVNRSYSGLTLLYSRFLHCFEQTRDPSLVDELRGTLLDVCPDGAVFAELTGGYDTTNLNLHPPVTEYEIVCPGESSSRPDGECIRVEELRIEYGAEHGLHLYCPRLDRAVIPVYLGFLMPLALPEVQRALLLFSPTAMAPLDLWQGTDRPLGEAAVGGHPRVRYRDLVLARHTWKTAPDRLPRRRPEQSDAEWFLSWRRWRTEHRLPRRVFAAVDTASTGEDGEAGPTHPSKPQYVDFDSFLSLQLLDHMVADAQSRVVMTEMLPGPEELWLRTDEGAHVAEQTVEITRTPAHGARTDEGKGTR